jgi:indolepyruvate ferredoxin oxidoreductase beta subunit
MNTLRAKRRPPSDILVCALGGEGGGVLAEWLYRRGARRPPAQSTSIPGVAQRTGATTYYVEVCPLPDSALAAGARCSA